MMVRVAAIVALLAVGAVSPSAAAGELECLEWQTKQPEWIWCDDFEDDDRLALNYFEVTRSDGRFGVSTDSSVGGRASLRAMYMPGREDAGGIKLSFGRTPVSPQLHPAVTFEEVYWRVYIRMADGWEGNATKTSRAIVFAGANWSQAAIGHVWEDSASSLGLGVDPVSGVVGSTVVTTRYNDFLNFRWLGHRSARTQVYSPSNTGKWFCVEAAMRLNAPGASDGSFRLWIDNELEVDATGLSWRGSYTAYGINAVFLENYINGGPRKSQVRYMDNFVVSRNRIGCQPTTSLIRPNPPTAVRAE